MDWSMVTPAGTAVRRRWTLDDDPRYVVEDRAGGRCAMLIDDRQVDDASTPATAMYILELRYEAEVHAGAFELARLRLRQAEERITSRFPTAARDGKLASILSSLGDALGSGPEAAEPDPAPWLATDVFRYPLGPQLAVAVDASLCTVLEVASPQGKVLARVALSSRAELASALQAAGCAVESQERAAAAARVAGRISRRTE